MYESTFNVIKHSFFSLINACLLTPLQLILECLILLLVIFKLLLKLLNLDVLLSSALSFFFIYALNHSIYRGLIKDVNIFLVSLGFILQVVCYLNAMEEISLFNEIIFFIHSHLLLFHFTWRLLQFFSLRNKLLL